MKTLRQDVQEYLTMRRNLGFKLRADGNALLNFIKFLELHHSPYITQELALAWAQKPKNVRPAQWAQRLCYIRGFASYRSSTDPRTQIPSPGLLPFRPKRARPYLYSDGEIKQLLCAALNMPTNRERRALLPRAYYCLFGLLCVTGLRIGEANNLTLQDVDLKSAVLTIRSGKFGKDRLVPLHISTCKVLADYIARRKRFVGMFSAAHNNCFISPSEYK